VQELVSAHFPRSNREARCHERAYLILLTRLAKLPAHDAEVDVRRNHADEWSAQLEELVEGNLFLVAVATEDAVALRKNGPLCFERVGLPEDSQDFGLDLLSAWAKHLVVEL
jgi:hypothetical protein